MIRYNTSRGVRSYVVEDEVTTNKTSYTFKLLDPSTEYIFNVKSYTKDGMSSKVAIVQATKKGREGTSSVMFTGFVNNVIYIIENPSFVQLHFFSKQDCSKWDQVKYGWLHYV